MKSARSIFTRLLHTEFIRYFFASGLALGLDFGLLNWWVYRSGWDYQWAAALSFTCGAVLAYVLSLSFVFRARSFEHWSVGLLGFFLVGLMGLAVNALLLRLAIESLGANVPVAKVFAAGLGFIFNFLARKTWLFTKRGQTTPELADLVHE